MHQVEQVKRYTIQPWRAKNENDASTDGSEFKIEGDDPDESGGDRKATLPSQLTPIPQNQAGQDGEADLLRPIDQLLVDRRVG